jgi:hypothetical protein
MINNPSERKAIKNIVKKITIGMDIEASTQKGKHIYKNTTER